MSAAATQESKNRTDREHATAEGYLTAIRQLWERLHPNEERFNGSHLEELEYYFNRTIFDMSSPAANQGALETQQQPIRVQLCAKIGKFLISQCRRFDTQM